MNDIIDANLNAKANEKIKLPKNPDIVLLIWVCWYVRGSGWFITVILIAGDGLTALLINVYAANVGRKK